MRKNMVKVIDAFMARKAAVGDAKHTCSTDGETVFSYQMRIAVRYRGKIYIVRRELGPSRTTKCQISAVQFAFPGYTEVDEARLRELDHKAHGIAPSRAHTAP